MELHGVKTIWELVSGVVNDILMVVSLRKTDDYFMTAPGT